MTTARKCESWHSATLRAPSCNMNDWFQAVSMSWAWVRGSSSDPLHCTNWTALSLNASVQSTTQTVRENSNTD